jgi:hypothetical protein
VLYGRRPRRSPRLQRRPDPDEEWVARATELAADDGDSVVFLAVGADASPIGMAGA